MEASFNAMIIATPASGSAGVSPAYLPALQPLLANNHTSRRLLADSEIAGIRICEPAGRRRSQGRTMRKYKKHAALGETPALPGLPTAGA